MTVRLIRAGDLLRMSRLGQPRSQLPRSGSARSAVDDIVVLKDGVSEPSVAADQARKGAEVFRDRPGGGAK